MTRSSLIATVVAIVIGAPVHGQTVPATMAIGSVSVPMAAQARRTHLIGAQDLYLVTIYKHGAIGDTVRLASPEAPKALRIDVGYEDDLSSRTPLDWRRELVPLLDPAATAHLRGSFAPLRRGDVVVVEYDPRKGTTVRVNDATVVSAAHHDLMAAFLDHWLGQQPVSEELKQTLLRSP
jgi:Chalcone isomerase-like